MRGAFFLVFVAAVILGGFVGWGIAYATGQGSEGQSTYTGYGCGVGVVVGTVACGALALVRVNHGEEKQDGEGNQDG